MKKLYLIFLICIFTFTSACTYAQVWAPLGSAGFSTGVAQYTAMAIDKNGTPYVAYQDGGSSSSRLTVMKYNGSSWVTVGSASFSAGGVAYVSIAIDTSGTPYVAYMDYADDYKATVMKYNGSSWVTVGSEGFSAGFAQWESIAIDKSGTPYVVYLDGVTGVTGGQTTVMKYNGSSWVNVGSPGFSDSTVQYTTIAIDSSGTPYVAYQDEQNSYKATVMKFNGTGWVTVGSAGFSAGTAQYTSIAIDTGGTPYIVYSDYSVFGEATVKKFFGGSWVAVGSAGFTATFNDAFITIAIDRNGTPYVAYEDNAGRASVMKYSGSSWAYVGSSEFSAYTVEWPSIAINTDGTPFVAYEDAGNGNKATVMELTPPPAPITGIDSICIGDSVTLSDTTTGGVWSSSNTGIATVRTATGTVTGVAMGVVTISYTTAGGSVTFSVTVNGLPSVGPINGAASVCAGLSVPLTDATSGGAWNSSDTTIANISTTGMVTGGVLGTATITYSVMNSCSTAVAVATYVVTVAAMPAADSITGPDVLCADSVIILADTATGGVWVSGNAGIATVGTSGIVTGVAAGTVVISYVVTNICASLAASQAITVNACTTGIRTISSPVSTLTIFPNPATGTFTLRISSPQNEDATVTITNMLGTQVQKLSATTNCDMQVQMDGVPGVYFVHAITGEGRITQKVVME